MKLKIETLAIHGGQTPEPVTGAIMTPIFQTSTYVQPGVGENKGYEYSRTGNPTRKALEDCLAGLEGAQYGLAFSSGMAATDTVVRLLKSGDHVVCGNDVYGGTFRLFDKEFRRFGFEFDFVDTTDVKALEAALRPETRLVWLETPTNPLLNVSDIRAIAEMLAGRKNRPLLAVDNTFATPYLQRPLELGADVVVHSTTKYLGGHSDAVGGAIAMNDTALYERLKFMQNAIGAVPGPMDCFLVLRGIKTLHLRMDRHASNAEAVANYLSDHPKVKTVTYPFHESHPQYAVAKKQMRNGGGMISIVMNGGEEAARKLAEGTKVFALAESLGGVESLIELPAGMTHLSVAASPLAIDTGLVRLSVGVEHVDDLLLDIEQALGKV
ncbi:MAG: cystathionine gamma-synthase [Anaerolineae bacterium]|nr:MAG: cystathionine gamma-synthase [Anaerolineae bacterium]